MDYSKQKLLLSLLVKFQESFSKQINESGTNQKMEQFIQEAVQEMVNKQYRGSLFDKKIGPLIHKVDQAQADEHLVLNDYSNRLWKVIVQISKRTTSFETAYALIDVLGSKNTSLKL